MFKMRYSSVMYCIDGESRSSLLIESTDSMIYSITYCIQAPWDQVVSVKCPLLRSTRFIYYTQALYYNTHIHIYTIIHQGFFTTHPTSGWQALIWTAFYTSHTQILHYCPGSHSFIFNLKLYSIISHRLPSRQRCLYVKGLDKIGSTVYYVQWPDKRGFTVFILFIIINCFANVYQTAWDT